MMAGGFGYCEEQPMDDVRFLNPSIADYKLIRSRYAGKLRFWNRYL